MIIILESLKKHNKLFLTFGMNGMSELLNIYFLFRKFLKSDLTNCVFLTGWRNLTI